MDYANESETLTKKFLREPFLSGSHLFGSILAAIGTILLLDKFGQNLSKQIVILIYGGTLVTLLLASTLCHGVNCTKEKSFFYERLDYISIYFFIAGTYTPICIFTLEGYVGWCVLIFQWSMALLGAFITLKCGFASKSVQVLIFTMMGLVFLVPLNQMIARLSYSGLCFLIAGVASYLIGSLIFAYAPPHKKINKYICPHGIWHLLVLVGMTFHYFMIYDILIA